MKTHLLILLLFLNIGLIKSQSTVPENYSTALQELLDSTFSSGIIPGISAAVNFKEDGEWSSVAGNSYSEVPLDTSMLFGMASNTKLFTSAICVKMASHGYFSLDDSIGMWIPDFLYVDPTITIRQLLQHNSGLNDFINNSDLFPGQVLSNPTKIWTPAETLTYILEPITTPNNGIFYSNANYILAAMVLESATELKYIDLVRDSLFEPLGLSDIFFEGFDVIEGNIAHPFFFGTDYSSTPRTALGTITWSAGTLITRPSTLTKWYNEVFNRNFLGENELNEIMSFVEWPDDPEMKMMGLGLYKLNINDRIYYGHGGRTIGYSSYTLYDIECGHSINVATNEFLTDALSIAVTLAEKACELTSLETSVIDINDESSFFPNPANNYITFYQARKIAIYNTEGQKVLSSTGKSTISVEKLPSGIYYMQIRIDNKTETHKLIIAH